MSASPWGVPAPAPTTESKFFNAARRTVTLLVESGVDGRFWRIYRHHDCLIRHMNQGGRASALVELNKARANADAVLLGILDADLDRIQGRLEERDDVVWTDSHDLETTLLGLPVLEKIVRQFVDPEKLGRLETSWSGQTFRDRLFRHAEGLGRLRWLKVERHPELEALEFKKQKKGDIQRFDAYDEATGSDWSPSLPSAVAAVIAFSNAQKLKSRDLQSECMQLGEAPLDQICNGHDLVGFMHAFFSRHAKDRIKDVDTLTSLIQAAVERTWLSTTAMWTRLRTWESNHPGFRILADDIP